MATQAMIDEFLGCNSLALIRYSRNTPIRGVKVDDELGKKGYTISVVYLENSVTESRLSTLEGAVEGAIIAVPREHCQKAVEEAIEAKIPRIWLQKGCESKEAIDLCEKNEVPVVHGACVLMYAQPVESFHAVHRWIWKKLGLLAK